MATQPTNDLLVWANTDVNLPNLAGPNKTEPSADLVAKGWDFKQKPSADEFNYILNNLSEWVEYLKTVVIEATPEATANTLALRDTNGSFKVKQLTSIAPNGTAPLVVSSTTKVDNLNADLLDGMSTTSTPVSNTVCSRDGNGDVAARAFVGSLVGNANTATKWQTARTLTLTGSVTGSVSVDGSGNVSMTTSVSSSSGVAILTGTVANGGTIPLPSGFSEAQCKWMVSIDNSNSNGTGWDIDNAIVANHISHRCYTTGRVVTANTTVRDEAGFITYDATANYIIIGVK